MIVCMCVCANVHVYVCMYVYVYVYVYIYIYIYICIHSYTRKNTQIRTFTCTYICVGHTDTHKYEKSLTWCPLSCRSPSAVVIIIVVAVSRHVDGSSR
jgi:hypothetical protein